MAVESFYSMDGDVTDVCPLKDLVEAANEVFPICFMFDSVNYMCVLRYHMRATVEL